MAVGGPVFIPCMYSASIDKTGDRYSGGAIVAEKENRMQACRVRRTFCALASQ